MKRGVQSGRRVGIPLVIGTYFLGVAIEVRWLAS